MTTVLEEGLASPPRWMRRPGRGAEVSFRGTGLAVSLGAILLVVVALQLKIRTLPRAEG